MNLRIEDLSHTYPGAEARQVLCIDAWALKDGDQILLRGVSGSGKTTLFNIVSGLLHPTTGAVYYDDRPLYGLAEAARDRYRAQHIGYIFQNHNLIGALTALENVMMPLAFARTLTPAAQRKRAIELLEALELSDYIHTLPKRMSAGQRLRVAVARALANNPRVLLADEPTAALDEHSGEVVIDLLQSTCADSRAILIVASHDPALISRFHQRVDLHAGQLHEAQWA
ncbi:MAG: ABC transporter ATP-binding protein [Anaerolineae bacterium]|nr:ABC transporter ATP-binding protein [Anaerolineae bacterium]